MSVNVSSLITALCPAFNASDTSDMQFWTTTDLYEWADEAVKRLARLAACFTERDTSISTANATQSYALPPRHLSLLHLCIGTSNPLGATTQRELAALSDTWQSDAGTPEQWAPGLGLDNILLYPIPTTTAAVELIQHAVPPDVSSGSPTLEAPDIVGDYILQRMLAEARRKEGPAALLDVAAAMDARTALIEKACVAYFGETL